MDEKETLEAEIEALKREREALEKEKRDRLEFSLVFPGTDLDSLPDTVRNGPVPPVYAYALETIRRQNAEAEKARLEAERRRALLGDFGSCADEFFTREEVGAMTPREVRKNYEKIKRSMKKWKI